MSAAVEVALIWGGDLTIQANGDLLLSFDTPGNPEATFERVLRIVMTNPTQYDASGNPISPPDYLSHPNFGAGVRGSIGEPFVPALTDGIVTRVRSALAADPYIASDPAPKVNFTQLDYQTWQLIVECYAITGAPFVLPAFAITPSGIFLTPQTPQPFASAVVID